MSSECPTLLTCVNISPSSYNKLFVTSLDHSENMKFINNIKPVKRPEGRNMPFLKMHITSHFYNIYIPMLHESAGC